MYILIVHQEKAEPTGGTIMCVNHLTSRVTLILAAAIAAFPGCATIFHDSTAVLELRTYPGGADITINGKPYGMTPNNVDLEKDTSYTVEFRKAGYMTRTVVVNRVIGGGWLALDLGVATLGVLGTTTGPMFETTEERPNREANAPLSTLFALAPFFVDAMTGKWYDINQDQISIVLEKMQ